MAAEGKHKVLTASIEVPMGGDLLDVDESLAPVRAALKALRDVLPTGSKFMTATGLRKNEATPVQHRQQPHAAD